MGGLESGGYGPLVVGLARVDVIRSIRPGGPARHLAIEAIAKVRTANESFAERRVGDEIRGDVSDSVP